jgi:glucan phosphoethanolaminetransferase (alkaline phosphatase superfamily)
MPIKIFPLALAQTVLVLAIIFYQNWSVFGSTQQGAAAGLLTLVFVMFTVIYGIILLLAAMTDRRPTKLPAVLLIVAECLLVVINPPAFIELQQNPGGQLINVIETLMALAVIAAAVMKLRQRQTPVKTRKP